jgi:DegV family protein with EDD domain
MSGVRFVCDSTADLDPDYYRRHGIVVVPLKVNFGEESLVDGVDIDAPTFYARMRATDRNPTTSQPTPAEFEAAFRAAGADGATVVCTTLSAEMSGTYGAAVQGREAVPDLDVRIIDTRSVSIGHGIILEEAVAAAEAGADADTVVALIRDLVRRQRVLFTVSTLEYLRRGGRIGGAAALVGSVLSIKPVLQLVDGRIEPYDRVRTYHRALERIADEVAAAVGEAGRRARVAIGHADRPEEARMLAERLAPHCEQPPRVGLIGPIVGCHGGPGTVGVAFHIAPR